MALNPPKFGYRQFVSRGKYVGARQALFIDYVQRSGWGIFVSRDRNNIFKGGELYVIVNHPTTKVKELVGQLVVLEYVGERIVNQNRAKKYPAWRIVKEDE